MNLCCICRKKIKATESELTLVPYNQKGEKGKAKVYHPACWRENEDNKNPQGRSRWGQRGVTRSDIEAWKDEKKASQSQ